MVAKNVMDSVFAMPLADQVELLERLRERLRNEPELQPLSDEHRRLLDKRIDEFEREPLEGMAWSEFQARLRTSLAQK